MASVYLTMQYIKTVESILTTFLLHYFVPKYNPAYEPRSHLAFYIFTFYAVCIGAWVALINVWIMQRDILLCAERAFALYAGFSYILVSIVCVLPVDEYSEHSCHINSQYSENWDKSLATLFTGLVFLLHAILTTDMVPEGGRLSVEGMEDDDDLV